MSRRGWLLRTGAAAGALAGSRWRALLLGPVLHLAGDRFPHEDIGSRRFEIRSGIASVALLAARRGPLDPATLGALAASAPDLEHVFPSLRPGGEKLFHGSRGWHRSGAFPAKLQLLLAGNFGLEWVVVDGGSTDGTVEHSAIPLTSVSLTSELCSSSVHVPS